MARTLLLGTRNQDKVRELSHLLRDCGIKVLSLEDFPYCPPVSENGKTFESNAKKKARAYSRHTQLLTLADDSGLLVTSLKGAPGVTSARYAGKNCSYRDNNLKILKELEGVPVHRRGARFVTVIAIYADGRFIKTVRGECVGRIGLNIRGTQGFGYDPIFIPRGSSKTFAELTLKEKNQISHRSKALQAAKRVLTSYLRPRRGLARDGAKKTQ